MGISGMQSHYFEHFMGTLCDAQGVKLADCFANSFCLSADVTNAFDPNFADTCDKRNNAQLNYGVALSKYTGSRGKNGASDAAAEAVGHARTALDNAGVIWQIGILGKVDQGGGGTVAAYMANRNIVAPDWNIIWYTRLTHTVPTSATHTPERYYGARQPMLTLEGEWLPTSTRHTRAARCGTSVARRCSTARETLFRKQCRQ